ncbi:nitrilase-related carbon-nitrogen hydrolase [Bacteroidota bacterium]
MIKAGFFQFNPFFGEVQKNLDRVIKTISNASADLIVLPELPFSGYYFKDREELSTFAEDPKDSNIVSTLVELCRDKDLFIVTGFVEKDKDKIFNSALLLGADGVIQTYRKLHLFNTEKLYFDPGNLQLEVSEIRGIKVGLMICFDYAIPEVARTLALKKADLLCNPSNLVLYYSQKVMPARCFENSVFAITSNRFGTDERSHGNISFSGQSQITGPRGEVIYQALGAKEELYIAEIDPSIARDKKVTVRNDLLADRRTEFYQELFKK